MRDIRVVGIDLDDTLWPVMPVIRRAEERLHRWLAERCPRITASTDVEGVRAVRAEVIAEHPQRSHDFAFLRLETLGRLAAAHGYPRSIAEEAFAVFHTARNDVELFADALPALERLAQRYELIALTNGTADLARIGIGHLFAHSLRAREVGALKPDRAMFDAALELTGVDAASMVHVGDQPVDDVAGARGAGLHAVWLNRSGDAWPQAVAARPDAEIHELGELVTLLDDAGFEAGGRGEAGGPGPAGL